jgi:hypothetical protein
MRLIHAGTLEMKEFVSEIPHYAILSHTWREEEVSYKDFQDVGNRSGNATFEKIRLTCNQALQDGLEYVWVDTCCIDKTSSSELSEAINSMFKWYQRSKKCYAYLEDVDGDKILTARNGIEAGVSVWHPDVAKSRWFTRGWTLQELIAPSDVQFYSGSWVWIGSKRLLMPELHDLTEIDESILSGAPLSSVSVGERMRWAAYRETTREEDIAYCLMGIFDVNMPMLYGEGSKAFIRLQEEIIKECDDHSLFAWQASLQSEIDAPIRGVLAQTPREFAGCRDVVPFRDLGESNTLNGGHIILTSRGLRITSTTARGESWYKMQTILLGLNCRTRDNLYRRVSVQLVNQGGNQYLRTRPSKLFTIVPNGPEKSIYIIKNAAMKNLDLPSDLRLQYAFHIKIPQRGVFVKSVYPKDAAEYNMRTGFLQLRGENREKKSYRAALIIRCESWDIVMAIFGLTRDETNGGYFGGFALRKEKGFTAGAPINDPLDRIQLPGTLKTIYFKQIGNTPKISVNARPEKLLGVDAFSVEILYEGDRLETRYFVDNEW